MINPEHLMVLSCEDCDKRAHCKKACVFIDKLAGKGKSTRELIPPPDPNHAACSNCKDKQTCITGSCEYTDYKLNIIEVDKVRQNKKKRNIMDIRELEDTRIKAVTALLYAGFKVKEIPYIIEVLNIKERRLYQIIEECTTKTPPHKG
jgi:hypothetical protein